VEKPEIDDWLTRHRARRLRWWLCRCGLPHPCGARVNAEDELIRLRARPLGDWYREYFARLTPTARQIAALRDAGRWV